MAGLKEIKRRLKSVKNTQKITYAMKLVSAAKLRKAQDSVTNSRAYTAALGQLLAQVSAAGVSMETPHPLLESRKEVKRVALLVIGGQRGLSGAYNSNVNRKVESTIKEIETAHPGAQVSSFIVGKKPADYFRRRGRAFEVSYEELPEDANLWPIEEISGRLESAFRHGEFDRVYMIFTRFKSAISQTALSEAILPLDVAALETASESDKPAGLVLFEPSAAAVFSALLPRILSTKIRQACLDAKASETASRMTAMDAATKNAKQLGKKLELTHNKLRQLRITSELLDIIGGAEAIK